VTLYVHAIFHVVWQMGRFQSEKVTFKVIQGHWQWCHFIGRIRFSISLPWSPGNWRDGLEIVHDTLPDRTRYFLAVFGVILQQYFHFPVYQRIRGFTTTHYVSLRLTLTSIKAGYFSSIWMPVDFGDQYIACPESQLKRPVTSVPIVVAPVTL